MDTLGTLGLAVIVATMVDTLIAIPESVTVADSGGQQVLEFITLGMHLGKSLHQSPGLFTKRKSWRSYCCAVW